MHNFDVARENMIHGQLRPNGIEAPALLAALQAVPREKFVPRHLQRIAYVDEDVEIAKGRYMPEPVILARLLQALDIQDGEVALDIGCGSGYSTALLGQMAATVVALESDKLLAVEAERLLRELDICNTVVIEQADMAAGFDKQAPYHVILINGSVSEVPASLMNQLADGGRLATVISKRGHMGPAVLITRTGDNFSTRVLFDAATPPLPGFQKPETFVF
jgi:protein-L-isoaspartate(D-aspartate) O-methyltransferase